MSAPSSLIRPLLAEDAPPVAQYVHSLLDGRATITLADAPAPSSAPRRSGASLSPPGGDGRG